MPAATRADRALLHATCLAVAGHGVLIRGGPGSGKSDLALRLIDQPGVGLGENFMETRLVADDQVVVVRQGDRLLAESPPELAGRLEIRGLGIVELSHTPTVGLELVVQLADATEIDRLPDPSRETFDILGIKLPAVSIDPRAASAPARIRAAVVHLLTRPAARPWLRRGA